MSFGFWLFLALVWVVIGTGVTAWNGSFRYLREPGRRNQWSVVFDNEAFQPEGQRLRRRAFLCTVVGLSTLALYYVVVAPRLR